MITQRKVAASKVIQARQVQLRQGPVSPRLVLSAISERAAGAPELVKRTAGWVSGRAFRTYVGTFGTTGRWRSRGASLDMAWFLRAIELDGGQWACRFGRREFDVHSELDQALTHLRQLAIDYEPAQLFVHRLDGSVDAMAPD